VRRISSRMTFFYKRVFPVIWFGFLALFIAVPLFSFSNASWGAAPPLQFFIGPVIMMIVGYFIMKKLVFDLVDEVWDDGGSLVIKNRGDEARVSLSDIKNVSYSPFMNPPRVTLSLRNPTVFGDEITFNAPTRFLPFSPSPIVKDLIDRVDLARRKN
jgi:hypothetical protein